MPITRLYRVGEVVVPVFSAIFVVILLWHSYFYTDDFMRLHDAATARFGWHYLSDEVFGHFAPGFRFVYMGLQRQGLPDYRWAIALTALMELASVLLLQRLLTALFGRRTIVLAVVAAYAISPAFMVSLLWFANTLHVMPSLICVLAACDCFVRYLATGKRRFLVGVGLAAPVGLMFYEKTVLILIYLPLLLLLIELERHRAGPALRHSAEKLLSIWPVILGVVSMMGIYFWNYYEHYYNRRQPRPGLIALAQVLWRGWVHGPVTFLIGGPYKWFYDFPGYGQLRPGEFEKAVGLLVLGSLVVVTCLLRRAAWRGWAFAVISFSASFSLVALGRLVPNGQGIGDDPAYLSDTLPFVLIGAMFALLPLARSWDTPGLERSLLTGRWPQFQWGEAAWSAVALICLLAYTGGALVSDVRFDRQWNAASPGPYIHNLLTDLDHLEQSHRKFSLADVKVYPTASVPSPGQGLLSQVMSLYRPLITYDDLSEPLYVPNPVTGHLEPAELLPANPTPSQFTFAPRPHVVDGTSCFADAYIDVTIPLASAPTSGPRFFEVTYRSQGALTVEPIITTPTGIENGFLSGGAEPLKVGRHTQLVRVDPLGYSKVDLAFRGSGAACLGSISAITVEPAA